MFIQKLSLHRRTFLRGAGCALALPLLDAMIPAATAMSRTAAAKGRSSTNSTSSSATCRRGDPSTR